MITQVDEEAHHNQYWWEEYTIVELLHIARTIEDLPTNSS